MENNMNSQYNINNMHEPKSEVRQLADKMEYTLSVFLNELEMKLASLELIMSEKYKEGLRDGIEIGRELDA